MLSLRKKNSNYLLKLNELEFDNSSDNILQVSLISVDEMEKELQELDEDSKFKLLSSDVEEDQFSS